MPSKATDDVHANGRRHKKAPAGDEMFAVACFAAIDHLRVALDVSPDAASRAEVIKALKSTSEALDLTLTRMSA
jgi:hypothetical protein